MNFISESLRLRIVLVFVAFSILLGGALAAVLSAFFQITGSYTDVFFKTTSLICFMSRKGRLPKSRLYSLLKCDGLS